MESTGYYDEVPDLYEDEDDSYLGYDDDDGLTDIEADAMTLASAGMGTAEDYGYFGDPDFYGEG